MAKRTKNKEGKKELSKEREEKGNKMGKQRRKRVR